MTGLQNINLDTIVIVLYVLECIGFIILYFIFYLFSYYCCSMSI